MSKVVAPAAYSARLFASRDILELVPRFFFIAFLMLVPGWLWGALPPVTCPAGAPIGNVNLAVQSARGNDPIPLRTINRLEEGDRILYRPLLRSKEKREGDVAVVLVPVRKQPSQEALLVLDPKSADKAQSWDIPTRTSVVAFVYGPAGLNRKKVKHFLSKDDELVAQLADYAEKTAQTEALIQALSSNTGSSASVDAALQGFASQYGVSVKLDRTLPSDQQAMTLFRTLNPAMATYDPISPQSTQVFGQTAGVATSVAALFFGSPVGLAAGGTAMLMELRSIAFPNAEFRSSFAQPLPDQGLALCGNRGPTAPHTHVAYLWATRVPNVAPPQLTLGKANSVPISLKSPLPVAVNDSDWKYIERARNWTLRSEHSGVKLPVSVHKLATGKELEIDLTNAKLPPGPYQLGADWDWDPFQVQGTLFTQDLATFSTAHLTPDSQDRVIAGTGKIPVTVEGGDFEFVSKVEIKKSDDKFATAATVPFVLPKGVREGPQDQMDVQLNTANLDAGDYHLLVTQQDGKEHEIRMKVLPVPPRIDNLPMVVNRGGGAQEVTIRGQRLDLITRLILVRGSLELSEARDNGTARSVTIHAPPELTPGTNYEVKAFVKDRTEPITLVNAIHVVGPRPVIVDSKLSIPPDMQVALNPGELPLGSFVSGVIQVKSLKANSIIRIGCDRDGSRQLNIRVGEQSGSARVQQLNADQAFLSFDTSGWPTGCEIKATIDNGTEGTSDPYPLGLLLRLPSVDSFQWTDDISPTGFKTAILTGTNLETIGKAGMAADQGQAVEGLPVPVSNGGEKQTLKILLPFPPANPQAPLYVWLRGEAGGRLTTIREQPQTRISTVQP